MTSNVFTKKEILQNLASRGCFIDVYTLDAFFAKKKIEAIFEDSQGNEFFDNTALSAVMEELCNNKAQNEQEQKQAADATLNIDDKETLNIIEDIKLSDGTALKDKLQNVQNIEIKEDNIQNENGVEITSMPSTQPLQKDSISSLQNQQSMIPAQEVAKNTLNDVQPSDNILKDDIFNQEQDVFSSISDSAGEDSGNFDDITLLSESFEAQEKLRQYVMSELSKNNPEAANQRPASGNEFKLDISERTLNMIARTMAKKIAKYVGSIMAQDAKDLSKAAEYEEENKKLTQKTKELEEQNRKLRLLLAESNKNLNSYKPSIFGLYKKVDPKTNKK